MDIALHLARKGAGKVNPNPLVGAVIVNDGKIIGKGYHESYGKAHAEINAFKDAETELIEGSTMYVTLEPCSHYGKTPPCVDQKGLSLAWLIPILWYQERVLKNYKKQELM